jgi:hypothetical protein
MLVAEENRLNTVRLSLRQNLEEHITWLRQALKDLDQNDMT